MKAEILRERLAQLLEKTGEDPVPLAERLGRGRDYLTDFLSGRKQSIKPDVIVALAKHFKVSIEFLTMEATPLARRMWGFEAFDAEGARVAKANTERARLREVERQIPVVGEVAAGLWREAFPVEDAQASETIDLDVKGYERAKLYALKVVGNSMNLFYPPGRFVVIAPVAEAGVRPGDHVIVRRTKADLVEITIKELVEDAGRIALFPRSSDPAFQAPVYLQGSDADQSRPEVIGVVVADYGRRERPQQGFLSLPKTYAE